MPEHSAAYFTCDYLGGKPEHRSTCREAEGATTVRTDQGALWSDPATVDLPEGWSRAGGGHLCPAHPGEPTCSLVFNTVAAPSTPPGEAGQ